MTWRRLWAIALAAGFWAGCSLDPSGLGGWGDPDGSAAPDTVADTAADSSSLDSGPSDAAMAPDAPDARTVDSAGIDAADMCVPVSEACGNGVDDDCDMIIDESCGSCMSGTTMPCVVGDCPGEQTCAATSVWGDCTLPPELCNGVDDDCDGTIDDDATADCATASGCTVARFSGSTYLFCGFSSGWDDAQAHCAMFGYDLTTVGSDEERVFIQSTALGVDDNEWWIGLRDLDSDRNYEDDEWVRGTSSYRYWYAADPDSTGQCTMFEPDEVSGRWRDRSCSSGYRFACESR